MLIRLLVVYYLFIIKLLDISEVELIKVNNIERENKVLHFRKPFFYFLSVVKMFTDATNPNCHII